MSKSATIPSPPLLFTHHILCRGHKLDDSVIQLGPRPPIRRLIRLRIPIKQLRHLVAQITHAAFPPRAALDECHVRVDVTPASTTSGNHRITDHGDRLIARFQGPVGRQDQGEWELGFVQEGGGGGDRVDRRALVGGIGLCCRMRRDARPGGKENRWGWSVECPYVGLHADQVDRVERVELGGDG